jgi:ferrous iron transport protein A
MLKTPAMLRPGEKALIQSLKDSPVSKKLLEMGFLPGREIRLVSKAPGGNPLCFEVQGMFVALREEEARNLVLAGGES